LQQQAERLGFSERLQISVSDDMAYWLRAADLYVSCSATESFGLANLESLTAGVPSICTAVGGVPEVVGTGAMLIAADASDLPEALELLLSQETLRRELEQKALAWTAAWPDPAAVMERYVELYTNA
jgi:glycosyltransferase involved in cell wall biosynthesis